MPIYQFRCGDCQKRFEVFMTYDEYGTRPVECPHCHSQNVIRRIGRVRFARSEESRLDSMADPDALAGMEDDPRALGKMMRQMSRETGEDMPAEFDEVVDRLEAGQSPEDIEKAIPDLGEMGEGGGGGEYEDF
jgi:putative FmdB family regulatory protein